MSSRHCKNYVNGKISGKLVLAGIILLGVVCDASDYPPQGVPKGPRFLMTPPSRVQFSSTVGVTLNCLAEGSPVPVVTWLTREGRPLTSQPPLLDLLRNKSLALHPFSPERYRADIHAGTFRCSASNTYGTIVSPPIDLKAVVWQDMVIQAEGTEIDLGGTALLRCIIPSRHSPHVIPIAWETQQKTIYPSGAADVRYRMVGREGSLLVRGVRKEDELTDFVCKARDTLTNKVIASSPAKIKISQPSDMARPSILNKQHTLIIKERSSTTIACVATGTPTPTVRWGPYPSFGGHMYPLGTYPSNMRSHHAQDLNAPSNPGSAVLSVKGQSQVQTLVCTANNSLGIDQMTVEVKTEVAFGVSVIPAFVKSDLGGSVTFTCSLTDPKASVNWYKNGSPVVATGRILGSGRQLIISAVTHEDAGMYQCMGHNDRASGQASAQLELGDSAPVLIYQFIEQTIQTGPPVSLRCNAVGNPLPSVTWTLNGMKLPPSGRVVVREHPGGRGEVVSNVNISDARIQDGGVYRCTATNRAGTTFHEASLNVYGPPTTRQVGPVNAVSGKTLKLFCPVAGYPLTGFSWSKDGINVGVDGLGRGVTGDGILVIEGVRRPHDEGVYSCRAANREGRSAVGAVQVSVLVPPKMSPFPAFEYVVEGERKTLTCTVSRGDTPLTLTWLRDGFPLPVSGPAANDVTVVNLNEFNSVLSIDRVSQHHAGTYSCQASNAANSTAIVFTLVVHVPPRIDPFAFQEGLSEGMRTRVICGVSEGDPPLTLTWLKDGKPLSLVGDGKPFSPIAGRGGLPGTQVTVIDAFSSVLAITSLQSLHAGLYACVASNSGATVRFEAPLAVHDSAGSGISPMTDGYRDISVVEPHLTQLNNGSLFAARAEPGHGGTYLCRASNNVSRIDKSIKVVVKSAPFFTTNVGSVDFRSGEDALLECRVRGDPAPTVTWLREGRPLRHNHRYRETVSLDRSGDTVATLRLSGVGPRDAGRFSCLATNDHGKNYQDLRLTVHEPPTSPQGLRVVSETSRGVRLSWKTADGAAPTTFTLQYKKSGERWSDAVEKTLDARDLKPEGVDLTHLQPATRYVVRVTAGNQLGRSTPSEELVFSTAIEKPGTPPREVVVESLGPRSIKVKWRSPPLEHTRGQILGFHVGYAPKNELQARAGESVRYNFTTVDAPSGASSGGAAVVGEGDMWTTTIKNLRPYTSYQVVVQAFNSEGNGPLSSPHSVITLEDAPSAAPRNVRCTTASKDSVQLSWSPPPPSSHNGAIRGYRVEYERENSYDDVIRHMPITTHQTSTHSTALINLLPATNYSIRINSYTSAGEGPWTSPLICSTHEDVPGRPDGVRGVVSGPGKFMVSWGKPRRRGGVITSYTISWKVVGSRLDIGRGRQGVQTVPGGTDWVQIEGVMGTLVEVDVSAATRKGKGPSASARVTLTATIPAAIYSLGGPVRAHRGDDVNLRCGHVGEPQPRLEWKHRELPLKTSAMKRIQADGSLKLEEVQREDSGNYTCTVSNLHGADHVTYLLSVFVPPQPPLVLVSSSTSDSILVQWKKVDDGGAPITGFVLNYRKDGEPWTRVHIHRHANSQVLKNLDCGSRYHVFLLSKNIVGSSPASKTAVARTLGGPPLYAPYDKFVVANSTEASVYTKTWVPQGCPITHFSVEYRKDSQLHWVQVSGRNTKSPVLRITGLDPATLYHLRANAESSAGTSSHTYQFTTLTPHGEVPNQLWSGVVGGQWLSLRVLLPLMTSAIALASSLGLVCYCVRKKQLLTVGGAGLDGKLERKGSCASEDTDKSTKESKYSSSQREQQFYATIRKSSGRDSQSDIPENASDIYPYATFQMANPGAGHEIPMYSIYHSRSSDQKSGQYVKGHRRRHSRNRSRGRSAIGDSEDYETMASDTETMLEDYETEQGVSSRTESSNHLEDMASMREHSLIYSRGVTNDGLTQGNPRTKSEDTDASTKIGSSCGDTIYGGGPIRAGQPHILQQRIHHNLLYHAESSTSPEQSPTKERKSFPRKQKPRTRNDDLGHSTSATAISSESIPSIQKTHLSSLTTKQPLRKAFQLVPKSKGKVSTKGGRFFGLGKRRTNSAGSVASRKSSKESLSGIEISETECDRAIVPPPRSYSDAKGEHQQEIGVSRMMKGSYHLKPHHGRMQQHQKQLETLAEHHQPEPHKRGLRPQGPQELYQAENTGKQESKDFSIAV